MQTPNYYAISSQEPADSKLPHKTCVYLWTFAFSFESDDSKFGEGRAPSRPPRGWIVAHRGAKSAEVAN